MYESMLILSEENQKKQEQNSLQLFQRMLTLGANLEDPKGVDTLISAAAGYNNFAVAKYIIDKEIEDVNIKSSTGRTALMSAAIEGNEKMCEWLIRKGAKKHYCDDDGNTAYDYAIRYNHPKCAEICKVN